MRIFQQGDINEYKTRRPFIFKCRCGCIWIGFEGEYKNYGTYKDKNVVGMYCPTCGVPVSGSPYEERLDI